MSNFAFNFFQEEDSSSSFDDVKSDQQVRPESAKSTEESTDLQFNDACDKESISTRVSVSFDLDIKPILDGTYFETLRGVNKIAGIKKGANVQSDILKITSDKNSDVVTGFYEGGLKLWECTLDLMTYLESLNVKSIFTDKMSGSPQKISRKEHGLNTDTVNVLDLGCGHGLAGIHAFLQFSSLAGKPNVKVFFQDLNRDVLKYCTAPNLFLNIDGTCSTRKNCDITNAFFEPNHFQFWSGDWLSLLDNEQWNCEVDEQKGFDLILTADTIYAEPQIKKLALFLNTTLAKQNGGIALVAAKRYYFGTGGNVEDFIKEINAVSKGKLICEKVAILEDKQSNIREIIQVSRAL